MFRSSERATPDVSANGARRSRRPQGHRNGQLPDGFQRGPQRCVCRTAARVAGEQTVRLSRSRNSPPRPLRRLVTRMLVGATLAPAAPQPPGTPACRRDIGLGPGRKRRGCARPLSPTFCARRGEGKPRTLDPGEGRPLAPSRD